MPRAGTERLLADAATASRLVEMLCPAAAILASLSPQQASSAFHNLTVEKDNPPRWEHAVNHPACEAQLLCISGLWTAVRSIYLPDGPRDLLRAARHPAYPRLAGGSGQFLLQDFFWEVHTTWLNEFKSAVVQSLSRRPLGRTAPGLHLAKVIEGRVALGELLLLTFNLLVRGHLEQIPQGQHQQQLAPQAAGDAATQGWGLSSTATCCSKCWCTAAGWRPGGCCCCTGAA